MTSWGAAASILVKYAGRALGGTAELARGIRIASLSVAESVLRIIRSGLAEDVGQWKTAVLDERKAKAAIRVAKAAEAANKVQRRKRKDSITKIEDQRKRLEATEQLKDAQLKAKAHDLLRQEAEKELAEAKDRL